MYSQLLSQRKRLLSLVALMVGVAILASSVMGWILYREGIKEQSQWLKMLAKDGAALISAVAQLDGEHDLRPLKNIVISELAEEGGRSGEFGQTGEVVLARQEGGEIVFLLDLRHGSGSGTQRLALDSGVAEPMRLALAGESGILIGPDYRNVTVLAAYEPVPGMAMGLVAKVDLDEIRAPLFRNTVIGGIGALIIIAFGILFALRLTHPLIVQLEMLADHLNEAQHTAGLGSWQWYVPSDRVVWSDEQFRIFGFEPNEITPSYNKFLQAVHPEDRERVVEAVGRALDAREHYRMNFRVLRPDGEVRAVDAHGVVHRDEHGRATSMAGTVLDVTELKRLEQVLAQERERAEEFLRVSQAMIVALDAEGRVTLINRRGCEILGYAEQEIIGTNWFQTVVPEDARADTLERHQASIRGVPAVADHCEYGVVTKAGERRHISWHGAVTKNDAGAIVGCLNSGVDVTSLKQAEEASRHMASHDTLTGLPNRTLFRDRMEQAEVRAQRENALVGLLYLDLNNFKPVNDTLGHAAGDLVLKEVAERLRRTLREVDTVARVGGDEFAVILGDVTDREVVAVMAGKITDTLAKPYTIGDRKLHLSASVGMAIYPMDATTTDGLLARADAGMYEDKRRRNAGGT